MIGLDRRATVHAEDPATGLHTTVLFSDVRVRMGHVNVRPAGTGNDRAELAALRRVLVEPSVVIPETARLAVDGVAWAPVAGTFGAYRSPGGAVVYRAFDAVRQA